MSESIMPWIAGCALASVALAGGLVLDLAPTDDAYITFRAAANLAEGHGPVYNPGERVEATSAFAFAVALGALVRLGASPQVASVALGLLCTFFIGWWLACEGQRRCPGRHAVSYAAVGASTVMLSIGPLYYVWTGMETLWCSALVLSGLLLFYRRRDGGVAPILAGLCLGLAAATRMESLGVVYAACLSALFAPHRSRRARDCLVLIASTVVVFAPALAYRTAFFGDALPNTYYAKLDGGSAALLIRGLAYTADFLATNLAVTGTLIAAAIQFFAVPAQRERVALLLGAAASQLAFCVLSGGDWFPFHRFAVPLIPIAGLLLADLVWHGIGPLVERSTPRLPWAWSALLLGLGLVAVVSHERAFRQAQSQQANTARLVYLGQELRLVASHDTTLLLAAAGALPYFSGLEAHDFYGLTDPVVARRPARLGRGLPGHEKTDLPQQIRRLLPDIIVLDSLQLGRPKRAKHKSKHGPKQTLTAALWLERAARANGYQLGTLELGRHHLFVALHQDAADRVKGFLPWQSVATAVPVP